MFKTLLTFVIIDYATGILRAIYTKKLSSKIGAKGIIKKDGSDVENIPYKETNMYVRKIVNNYQRYNIIRKKLIRFKFKFAIFYLC